MTVLAAERLSCRVRRVSNATCERKACAEVQRLVDEALIARV